MSKPYRFGDYTYQNSPLLEGIQVGDEVELVVRVKVTKVLPDKDVGGLYARPVTHHTQTMLFPIRVIKEIKVVQHA